MSRTQVQLVRASPPGVNGSLVRVAGVSRPIVPNKLEATNTSRGFTEDWSCQGSTNVQPR